MLPDTFADGDGEGDENTNTTENFLNYPNVFDVEIEEITFKSGRKILTYGLYKSCSYTN